MIFRATHNAANKFFLFSRTSAQNTKISLEARGALLYLLSKPDGWECAIKDLMREGNIGRDKAYRIVEELKSAGHIVQRAQRDESGKFQHFVNDIHESPFTENQQVEPVTGNQEAGEPDTEFQEMADGLEDDGGEPLNPRPEKPETAQPLPDLPLTAEPYTDFPYTENKEHIINRDIEYTESKKKQSIENHGDSRNPDSSDEAQTRTKGKKRKTTKSVSAPEDPARKVARETLMKYLSDKYGKIPDGGAQGKAIKWLLDAGHSPEICIRCFEALEKDRWRRRVSWLNVQTEIGAWLTKAPQEKSAKATNRDCPFCRGGGWRLRRPDDPPGPHKVVECECNPIQPITGGNNERQSSAVCQWH